MMAPHTLPTAAQRMQYCASYANINFSYDDDAQVDSRKQVENKGALEVKLDALLGMVLNECLHLFVCICLYTYFLS